jgi:hypothetical protein
MTQRTPNEPCLLCQINPATKTNSHILSKFLSTNFLGEKGTPRRGYEINSETVLKKKPRVIQDSAKESHLLCVECEEYFSVIEGLSSDTFNKWQDKVAKGDFTRTIIEDFLAIVDCNTSNPAIIRLFVYSLFWRVSISNHGLFSEYKLTVELEEQIRNILSNYKASTKVDFLRGINSKAPVPIYPFSIITSNTFKDGTANILLAPHSADPYCLVVDRFSFMLFGDVKQMSPKFIKDYGNKEPSDCRIMIFREDLWKSLMVIKPIEILVKQAKMDKK